MRSFGLTLCLLVSSFGARAEAAEDRLAVLEARVKALEQALREGAGQPAAPAPAAVLDGSYKAVTPDGKVLTLDLKDGKAVVAMGTDTKTGTYQVIGQRVVVTVDGKAEALDIEGGHLRAAKGSDKIDFVKSP